MKKVFGIAALALAVGGAGYLSRDIQAGHEIKAQKLTDLHRLQDAYNCPENIGAPASDQCNNLEYERIVVVDGYAPFPPPT
jgi:hypothetical protein